MIGIREALPRIFQKAYPILDPETKMLPAVSLLRFHEIDALLLSFEGGKKRQRAVFGSSILARLMLVGPGQLGSFLEEPCEAASEPLATVRANQSLSSLFETFAKTRFGFARVEESRNIGALASLSDVLDLYETGAITTDLTVKDVGSSVFSMPGETTLKKALEEMFRKRYRRMFVSGSRRFISDRGIISYIFSPAFLATRLQEKGARDEVLDIPISAVEKMIARDVTPDMTLKEAARAMKAERGGQCLFFDRMVVTPWDLIMKPWKGFKLTFRRLS